MLELNMMTDKIVEMNQPIVFTMILTGVCVLLRWVVFLAFEKNNTCEMEKEVSLKKEISIKKEIDIKKELLPVVAVSLICVLFSSFLYPGWLAYNIEIRSGIVIDLFWIVAVVVTVFGIRYLKLGIVDFVLQVFLLYEVFEYCYPRGNYGSMLIFSGYTLLLVETKIESGEIQRQSSQLLVSFGCGMLAFIIYDFLLENGMRTAYFDLSRRFEFQRVEKVLLLLVLTTLFCGIVFVIMRVLKNLLGNYLIKLQEFGEKYRELGYYLAAIPYLICICIGFLEYMLQQQLYEPYSNQYIYIFVVILFIGIQFFYLRLICSLIGLKEHIAYQESENDRIKLYQKDVVQNLDEIREMKHDLKNVFLTMGAYIDRNEDAELKEYYFSKIAPYAQNEIQRNDLYVKLEQITNEGIKAFLYYKFLQIQNEQKTLEFSILTDKSYLHLVSDESQITRMLGIFIDNALEEIRQMEDGKIIVMIKEMDQNASFIIKNTVREEVRKKGIYIGTSSKGLGRGNGLRIIKKMTERHDDIVWNSYFQNEYYVQSITFYKK